MSDTLIKVENVSKKFCRSLKRSLWYGMKDLGRELGGHRRDDGQTLRPDEFWAIKDVSFELKRGECLGLIGRNGAGKTTLLRMLNGLIKPDAGRIEMRGQVGALIALGAGFNPILTGRENIYINAAILGLSKKETDAEFDEIVSFAELEEFIDAPVQTYSSGMVVRLGFSIATTIRPPILLLDEVLAVGDISFRDKCYQRIGELLCDSAVIMVSHDLHSLHRLANTALLLHQGQVIGSGRADQVLDLYTSKTNHGTPSPKTVPAPWISEFQIKAVSLHSEDHDGTPVLDLDIHISFKSEKEAHINQALGNITGNGGTGQIAGQFDFQPLLNVIRRGENSLAFRVPTLQLAEGKYSITIVVFADSGRELAFSARDFYTLSQSGNLRFGAMYAPKCRLIK